MEKNRLGVINIFKKNIKQILISLLANPILIIGYWIFCYELTSLCMYGRINKNIYILLLCIVIFIFIITFTTIKVIKKREYEFKKPNNRNAWKYISIIIIVIITSFYGVKIYKSATNYGGKLAWFIERLKNERSVEFEHNDIYKDGVEGIFEDINKEYTLPKKLYISNNFDLKFNSEGIITSFYTFAYGKNDDGKDKSYLITYDKNKSQDITLRLNGYVNADYNDDKLVEPLIKTVKAIPVKKTVSKWNESEYGLSYYGKRSWGYNTDGIININDDGSEHHLEAPTYEIIGYTVSIFVPGKEAEIIPARYNLIGNLDWSKSDNLSKNDNPKEEQQALTNNNEQFYLSKEVGYKLNIIDKALGSTFYSLSKTIDEGKTWQVINEDPFNGVVGSASGINFIDEKLGFLGSLNPSGADGKIYRTDDGGTSFKEVNYNLYEVKLDDGNSISPFDSPGMPYEKDGIFNMLVGQGSDGDYNGNSNALYQSKDKGETWEYVREVKNS